LGFKVRTQNIYEGSMIIIKQLMFNNKKVKLTE